MPAWSQESLHDYAAGSETDKTVGQPGEATTEQPAGALADPASEHPAIAGAWRDSLHATTEGMRFWYEASDGLISISGTPYRDANCRSCHARDCNACHGEEKAGKTVFSAARAKDNTLCLKCHSRAVAAFKLDADAGTPDVHLNSGFECSKCHKLHRDDGVRFSSMRDPDAVPVDCTSCHKSGGTPGFDPKSKPHSRHKGKLHCNACHVSNSVTCYNCHFDEFLRTMQRPGNFLPPVKVNIMLINYQGQVTSANVQTMVSKKRKFAAFAPYFTHSIMKKGRGCPDCHGIDAALTMKNGGKVAVTAWKDGKLEVRPGVIPVVPGLLDFAYLDKADGQWGLLDDGSEAQVQFVGHATPLTEAQIKRLAQRFK